MSKQELMKYANDPFWVRLRTFLFILFWVVWVAMLVGAVLIIILAPGCPATASLPWYKKCALVRINVAVNSTASPKDQLAQASSQVTALKDNLDALKSADLDGILVSGLDPFLLANLDNNTHEETEKFRSAVSDLVQAAHDDGVKSKVIFDLSLGMTSDQHSWFKAYGNGSIYNDFYLYLQKEQESQEGPNLVWNFNSDALLRYGGKYQGTASLNYGNAELKEKMHALVLAWVRTKLDGIQTSGDFYVKHSDGNIRASSEANMLVHKWVKSGGQNKALMIVDSELASTAMKEGEEGASFELAPETALWKSLAKEDKLKEALSKLFTEYEQQGDIVEQTNASTPVDVGAGWRSFQVMLPTTPGNAIADKFRKPIAEGVLAAFYLLPKSTPIIQTEGAATEQLAKLKSDEFVAKLAKLRREQSESFMLGTTKLPKVDSDEVFALYRVYKDKNAYLLLINFAGTSKEIKVEGNFPDPNVFTSRVVLTDSEHKSSLGKEVQMGNLKLEPNEVLLVEFAPKE